uniref:Thiamine pyrophosphate enzyme domain protein TPP-binding n=1 Tax=Solibacter usitatus (strain Ellin6076) TaxID=234267 RepID=Q01RF5_SOLUE
MAISKKASVDRRGFLRRAAGGAAAFVAAPIVGEAAPQQAAEAGRAAAMPNQSGVARESGNVRPALNVETVEKPGSDYMVDVIKALGIEYVAFNPGSSFEGLHESLINYGNNSPEILTCTHEESAVAMAHGYYKIEGKPMLALLHGTIGIQHGSMSVYNAYCDGVPVLMIAGLDNDGAVAAHNATDMAAPVRDYVKWDHQPDSLAQFGQSLVRAYKLAMTPPLAPSMLVMTARLQNTAMTKVLPVPKLVMPSIPCGDLASVREAAKMLVAAENPRINAGRSARTQRGMDLLVQLAELLQAPVTQGDRAAFPSRHPLAGIGLGDPDLFLALEGDIPASRGSAKAISISTAELMATQNYNIANNPPQADLAITGDPEATLPLLIEEVNTLITADRKRAYEDRGKKYAAAHLQRRNALIDATAPGWNASPISLARLCAELWPLIEHDDWSLTSPQGFISNWPNILWNMDKTYRTIGSQGGGAMGYGAPASVGAALANRRHGRLSINIQCDGDLNYAPGVLWTAAHHRIPLLTIMHNNRGYHQEVMFIQQQCSIRNRGGDRVYLGTKLFDPDIDYASMAKAYGLFGEGPISDPKDLSPALKRGIERVKKGEPALIDVVTQPR